MLVTAGVQGGPKMAHFLYALTSTNIDRFSNLFHYPNKENICNNNVTKDPSHSHLMCVATLPCEMSLS